MAGFTRKVRNHLVPVHEVLKDELSSDIKTIEDRRFRLQDARRRSASAYKKLVKDEGFTEGECTLLLSHLRSDLKTTDNLIAANRDMMAFSGDNCLPSLCSGFSGKLVDVIANVSSSSKAFSWIFGECKFELKPGICGLFADEGRFRKEVDEKFENVEKHFARIGEQFLRDRLLFVTIRSYPQCVHLFKKLALGKEPHAIVKNRYLFQTVETISDCLRRNQRQNKAGRDYNQKNCK